MSNIDTTSQLLEYWVSTQERCGIILHSGEIIELQNASPTPADSFLMGYDSWREYEGRIAATWHTHPRSNANLSTADFLLFRGQPDWFHYIVAEGDVRCYFCKDNKVYLYEDDFSA